VSELPRIVDEYALDAATELSIRDVWFSDADRRWVLEHAATSLSEIEKATLRLVALKISTNVSQAAARLGMAAVSLSKWVGRRKLPPAQVAATASGAARR
jgi:ActR/RegA family two-component response regulator